MRLALGESHQDELGAGADLAPGPLAKREVEVVRLIAEGLSNKRIGGRCSSPSPPSQPTFATS
ncbi:MAG TPA: LuxR C-terminal-related transcriptional regulator [Candidatus Dormibacteraeota bacterium]|nr:LuxR C-terminal-related transcriptional regulator [Candidatus Dormibacteraeota bacterium]